MEATDYLQTLIYPIILSLPRIIVIFVGIGFSLVRYKNYPKVSIFALISLLMLAILQAVYIIQPALTGQLLQSGADSATVTLLFRIIGIGSSILGAAALAALIYAVWSDR